MQRSVVIIGGGIGGLALACKLGKAGYKVTVLEKNGQLGGRAGQLKAEGYTFDTGPTWLLMPDVFEQYFNGLGEDLRDHLELMQLSPSYRVYFGSTRQHIDISTDQNKNKRIFESWEPGAGERLGAYLAHSKYAYDATVQRLAYRNYDSLADLVRAASADVRRLHVLSSLHGHVNRYFKDPRLQRLFEYPAVFLGTSPYELPAAYCMLSHADFTQGVFYPRGGIYKLVEALVGIGRKHGVTYKTRTPVTKILIRNGQARGVVANGKNLSADIVISNADLHHTEYELTDRKYRDHSAAYWRRRKTSPSALLMYLGVNRRYDSLLHHTLLFSDDWQDNFKQIFGSLELPDNPSLYICAPSKTDPTTAPKGHESIFVLVPLPAGISTDRDKLGHYSAKVIKMLEAKAGLIDLNEHITYKHIFALDDFAQKFNSFHNSGLGLAHTLLQTALFRPHSKSRLVGNLYYVGADVHPGIGMPSVLISAELAYERIANSVGPSQP
jgi:phytoene desaturase